MTFAEAILYLRKDIMSEVDNNFFEDSIVQPWVMESARRLASELGFPQAVVTLAVTTAGAAATIPAGTRFIINGDVTYEGNLMTSTSLAEVRMRQKVTGIPSVYNYDPRKDSNFHYGPKPYADGDIIFDAVQELHTDAYSGSTVIWGGKFPEYHLMIPLDMARKAHLKNNTQLPNDLMTQFQELKLSLTALLKNTTPANLILPAVVADNAGTRMEGVVSEPSPAN